MKIYLLCTLLSLICGFSFSQISNDNNYLYRYVSNRISIDNRFELDTFALKDLCEIRFTSEDNYVKVYSITPITTKGKIEFCLTSKARKKEKVRITYRLRQPDEMRTLVYNPYNRDQFDITEGVNKIRIEMRSIPESPYYNIQKPTDYTITFPNGERFPETKLASFDTLIYTQRPEFVTLTNIRSKGTYCDFTSPDTITIQFDYPTTGDFTSWCMGDQKTIVTIGDLYFKKEVNDTLILKKSKCLYLNLNADGTENAFTMSSLNYERNFYVHDINQNPRPIDISNEWGSFVIEIYGDCCVGRLILILEP